MVRKGEKHDIRAKKKISSSLKKYFSNPFVKKKVSRLMKKRYSNPLARKKISKSLKKYFSNPRAKEKASKIRKKYYQEHPEFIKKMDRAVTNWWREHPNIKKEKSEYVKKFFIEHPEKFKKFMKNGKNSSVLHLKTKQGFLVRSRGEQKIANFLFDNNIKFSYEKEVLKFEKEGQICVPDFYLPKYKTYIEFYGGHPKAWKKKVLKNRLYKKYRIPCIFITPAELRDLNNYLIEELKKSF
jgi:hypothetical protein